MHISGEPQMNNTSRQPQQFSNCKSSDASRSPLCSLSALCRNAFTAISASTCYRSSDSDDEADKSAVGNITGAPPACHHTETVVRRSSTPILFSTNRGLHLRVAKQTRIENHHRASRSRWCIDSAYDIQFCDLERWNTRANAVSLEDTFTISKPQATFHSSIKSQQHSADTMFS